MQVLSNHTPRIHLVGHVETRVVPDVPRRAQLPRLSAVVATAAAVFVTPKEHNFNRRRKPKEYRLEEGL